MIANLVGDAQTAVTSLGGAVAGVASDKVANQLVGMAGLGAPSSGLGDAGLRFIIRAGVTSVVFGGIVSLMPQTADNIFFSVVFFAGNRALVNDAVLIGQILTKGALGVLGPPKSKGGGPPSTTGGCSCA